MQEKAERQQRCQAVEKLRETLDEKYLWEVILLYAGESFKTYTGLGSLTVGYQKKVPAGRIKPAFFVSNFWFLSIVFYCNVL